MHMLLTPYMYSYLCVQSSFAKKSKQGREGVQTKVLLDPTLISHRHSNTLFSTDKSWKDSHFCLYCDVQLTESSSVPGKVPSTLYSHDILIHYLQSPVISILVSLVSLCSCLSAVAIEY